MENREIKFRAWDKQRKEMFIPDQIQNPVKTNIVIMEGGEYRMSEFKLGEYVLMQYTGLKDRNGKEIFEGDLLKDGKSQIGQVLWAHNSYLIEWNERDYQGHRTYTKMTDDCFSYGEIIGNIYENPELLANR